VSGISLVKMQRSLPSLRKSSIRSLSSSSLCFDASDAPTPVSPRPTLSHPTSAPSFMRKARDPSASLKIAGTDWSEVIKQAQAQASALQKQNAGRPQTRAPLISKPGNIIQVGKQLRARMNKPSGFEMEDIDAIVPLSSSSPSSASGEAYRAQRSARLSNTQMPSKGKGKGKRPLRRPRRELESTSRTPAFVAPKLVNPKLAVNSLTTENSKASVYTSAPTLRPGLPLKSLIGQHLEQNQKLNAVAQVAEVHVLNNSHLNGKSRKVILNEVMNLTGKGGKEARA